MVRQAICSETVSLLYKYLCCLSRTSAGRPRVRYVCQCATNLPFAFILSGLHHASQPPPDGLWGVKPPGPSTLPTVLAPTLMPNIHTNTQCSSLSMCPQCLQVTGWGAKWHRATKSHLALSLVPRWAPWQHQAGLCCLWPNLRSCWCRAEETCRSWHWLGLGTGHCLFSITSLSPILSPQKAILQKCVCRFVWRQTDKRDTHL